MGCKLYSYQVLHGSKLFEPVDWTAFVLRQFIESDQDRSIYKAVPMPVDATLTSCIGQEQFLREKAFGVVPMVQLLEFK